MFVVKRDGTKQKVQFDKITRRLSGLCKDLDNVDPVIIAQKVCMGVYKGVTTTELDELAAQTAAHLLTEDPGYGSLAARICVSNLHKNTPARFSECATQLYNYVDPKTEKKAALLSDECYKVIMDNKERLDAAVRCERDFDINFFGFKTLERSYLMRCQGKIVERPAYMWMRVAVGIHKADIDSAIRTYELMSTGFFTHATPTLFNSATPKPQMSSCFLLCMKEDSIDGIFETLKRCAQISKAAGGIGLAIHKIRAGGSYIRGTNGTSNGLVPMLRVYNNTARYVDQGGGKRKGAFAIYLEPWHPDVMDFLQLRKNHGAEERRARDLFYALWVPDLFMKRVEKNGTWSLFCPNEAPGLADCWGEEFEALYDKYEREGRARKTIKARELWAAVLDSQTETGTPYILYKDACNRKSNQQNLGTIRCSNLCTEIVEYTSPEEVAVCNLASICLPKFVDAKTKTYDHKALYDVVYHVTNNLNKVIDGNFYPIKEAKTSNMRHRPIGIGVQGLADAFIKLRLPFESDGARQLNKDIFETIYFAALTASKDIAKVKGPYSSYEGSPVSKGILQFDMWGVKPSSGRWDWKALKGDIKQHGIRNSLLIAPMPTASTSQIMGNNECFEPYTSNIYVRRTLAGEFVTVNRHLLKELIEKKLWNEEMKNRIIANNGSVQGVPGVPADIQELYKTVWEIKGKRLLQMAADRGAFIDQSQSLNVHMIAVNAAKLTSMHFYAWKVGLKTGMYYLRTKAAADAIKFTVDQTMLKKKTKQPEAPEPQAKAAQFTTPVKKPAAPKSGVAKAQIQRLLALQGQQEECLNCGS